MNMMNLENIEEKKSNIDLEFKNTEKKYVYVQDVQIKYEILNPLMKNLKTLDLRKSKKIIVVVHMNVLMRNVITHNDS